jgi:hypothetical protein
VTEATDASRGAFAIGVGGRTWCSTKPADSERPIGLAVAVPGLPAAGAAPDAPGAATAALVT